MISLTMVYFQLHQQRQAAQDQAVHAVRERARSSTVRCTESLVPTRAWYRRRRV